jgi:hypothetical protein
MDGNTYVPLRNFAWVPWAISFLVVTVLALGFALWIETDSGNGPARRATNVQIGNVQIAPTPTAGIVPTPYGDVRIYKVGVVTTWQRTISRLETKEFDLKADAVAPRIGGAFGIGGESIQAHLVGSVIGRVDLSSWTIDSDMKTGDITISDDGETISIVLPYPDVTRPFLDETQSSFNNHVIGYFTTSDPNLWQAAHAQAAAMLVAQACEQGIGEKARIEAENQIKVIFGLGFKKVFVQTRPATKVCGS